MTWVWEHSWVKGSELLLLLAIADHADDQGRNAWPSIARLAERTRVDRRTVQRLLRRLAQQGCLAVEHTDGPRGTNRYTVLMRTATLTNRVDNAAQAGDNNAETVDNRGGGKMPPSGKSLLEGRHRSDEGAAPLPPEPPSTNVPLNPATGHLDLIGIDHPPTSH